MKKGACGFYPRGHHHERIQISASLNRSNWPGHSFATGFASPTGYQDIKNDGILTEGAAAYYERKAMGGVASVAICEGIVDGELGKGGDYRLPG